MKRRGRGYAGVAIRGCMLMATVVGCGTKSMNLKPNALPPGHAAIVGNVHVFKDRGEVTGHCYLTFVDQKGERKAYVDLDASGWVLISVPEGPTVLSLINCAVWNGLTHNSALTFDAARGRTTYFGHVQFELNGEQPPVTSTVGSVVVTIPGTMAPPGREYVANAFDEARRKYQSLYGSAGADTFVVSLVQAPGAVAGDPFLSAPAPGSEDDREAAPPKAATRPH